MPHLELWVRGHLCRVHAYYEVHEGGGAEFLVEDVRPTDGMILDVATLTDSEWAEITNALWQRQEYTDRPDTTWEWFAMTDGPWNYEDDGPLNEQISAAHREWRGYWL